jgi:Ca2+-binding RTX toxin-like protein
MARVPRIRPPKVAPNPTPPDAPRADLFKLIGTEGADNLFDQADFIRTPNTTNDRLIGNGGNDNILSSGGIDFIDGGSGLDFATINLTALTTGLKISGDIGSGSTATFSNGTVVTNVEQVHLQLGSGDDVIALSGGNLWAGGGGNDRLTGGDGSDSGGSGWGDDVFSGGGGNDFLRGEGGNDIVNGDAGNDEVDGGEGNDAVNGGAGNDAVSGGLGTDVLFGGAGADIFGISAGSNGKDVIVDFNYAEGDRIDASFFTFPPNFDSGVDSPTLVTDPIGQGFITVTNTPGGVLIALAADPTASLVLLNTSLDMLPADFLI